MRLSTLLAAALLLPFVACSDESPGPGGGSGGVTTGSAGGGGSGGGTNGGGGSGGAEPCGAACEDPTPLCDDGSGTCVECLDSEDCTDQASPVCSEGSCVECTAAEDVLCTGQTPWCDPDTNSCAPCRYHEQCPQSACNPFTGACLDATPETVGPSGDYADLTSALASVPAGGEAVFVVSPNTGNSSYEEQLQLGGGSVVALLGDGGRPRLTNNNSFPTFTVATNATLLLSGLDLRGNTQSRGLQVDGLVALDAVEVAQNAGGGIAAGSTAELLVRNSIVAANGNNVEAVGLGGAALTLLYSSVGGNFGTSNAISCAAGHDLTVRNSILFTQGTVPTLGACDAAVISHSAGDEVLPGTANAEFTVAAALFANLNNGDLRLTAPGATAFTDIAQWQSGDPAADIDGAPRPTADGSPDVCGADEGP